MPYDDETYEDEQPEPGHLDDEEELAVGPRRPVDEEEPEEELEIDRPAYVPPRPAAPSKSAPPRKKTKAKPKRKKKAAPKRKAKKRGGKAKKSRKRSSKISKKSKRGKKRR